MKRLRFGSSSTAIVRTMLTASCATVSSILFGVKLEPCLSVVTGKSASLAVSV